MIIHKSLFVFVASVLTSVALASTCEERAERYALEKYRDAFDRYMASCEDDNPPPSGCAGRLAAIHSGWSSSSLQAACDGAGENCVIDLVSAHRDWSSSSLNNACRGDYDNCAGRLASIHRGRSSSSLSRACSGANADCVIDLARKHPGWSSSSLNNACR